MSDVQVTPRFKIPRVRSARHLARVRLLPCCVPGCRVWRLSGCHAHHVRTGAGTGIKPDDSLVIPACFEHHMEIHQRGALTFQWQYSINLRAIAAWHAFYSRCLGILSR